jgi:tetratricopeptide (TPR) repeat protein
VNPDATLPEPAGAQPPAAGARPCPRCGASLVAPVDESGQAVGPLTCPDCGLMLSSTAEMPKLTGDTQPMRSLRPRRLKALLLLGLGMLALCLLSAGLAALAGSQQGLADRRAVADKQYQQGVTWLAGGHPEAAESAFEYVKQLVPDYPGIDEKLAEARAARQALDATASVTPTSPPTPTKTPVPIDPPKAWADAQAYFTAGKYEEALELLRQLQALAPSYETARVRALMFEALKARGLELLEEDRLEEGLFDLEQAAAIEPLDAETETARALAALYVTAASYWGVDWQEAARRFGELYAIAPYYKDVAQRLFNAHVAYGDQMAEAQDWCPAQEEYAAAVRLFYDADIENKRIAAAQGCLTATPTPGPGGISGTLQTPPPIYGFAGTLAYPAVNPDSGVNELYTFSAATLESTRIDVLAGQPSFKPGGGLLAYSSPAGVVGLFVVTPGGGVPQLVYEGAASYPTWSPDGTRLAYAAQNAGGDWDIFVVPVDGSAPPKRIERGWAPVWGPTGVLAFDACEEGGGACGIFLDNPDDDAPPVRYTASANDVPCSWSPDGQNLAFMSDAGGSWDVLLLNVSGGVAQVTSDPGIEALPAWAPDGSGLAFLSNRDGAWGIYLMRPDGGEQRKLLDIGTADPGWRTERLAWGW